MLIYLDYTKRGVVMVLSSEGLKLVKNTPKTDIFDQKKNSGGKSHFLKTTLIKVLWNKESKDCGGR